jgi:tetratricopeptide (TPR) repeat protein
VRTALRDELSATRRAHMHATIGEAIELTFTRDLDQHVDALAHHFTIAAEAGLAVDAAIRYAVRAANAAVERVAYEDAVRYCEQAAELDAGTVLQERERCFFLIDHGRAVYRNGDADESRRLCERAADIAEKLGDIELLAAAALECEYVLSGSGTPDLRVMIWLERVADTMTGDTPLRAQALAQLGRALTFAGAADAGAARLRSGIEMARRAGDSWTLGRALNAVYPTLFRPEETQARLAAAIEAHQLGLLVGDLDMAQHGADGASFTSMQLCDGAGARKFGEVAMELGRGLGGWVDWIYASWESAIVLCDGDFDTAERLAGEADDLAGDRSTGSGAYGVQMFAIRREQGRLAEAAPVMRMLASRGGGGAWKPGLAVVYAELDMRADAETAFEELAQGDFADLADDANTPTALSFLIDVCAYLGDRPRAKLLLTRLQPYAGLAMTTPPIGCYGPASLYAGKLHLTLNDPSSASSAFSEAIEQSKQLQSPLWQAHAEYWSARASGGGAAVAAALVAAEEMGMVALASRCRWLLTMPS